MSSVPWVAAVLLFSGECLAEESAAAIYVLIRERLVFMEEVALFKARNAIPVEDLEREAVVLESAKKQAGRLGLDADSVGVFYRAQIDAAKAIQHRFRADWLSEANPRGSPRDLRTEIRPLLLALGGRIARSIHGFLTDGGRFEPEDLETFLLEVEVKHLSQRDKRRIFDALASVELQ